MSEIENNSSYLDNMSLEEVKKAFGEGYVYKCKRQKIIEEKRKKRKSDEKNALWFLFAIIVYFISTVLSGTSNSSSPTSSNSGYQEKSCVDKHKEDYQAYLYCTRIKNLNR